MDSGTSMGDPLLMAKKTRTKVEPETEEAPLYIGAWIRACEKTPAEVSRKASINEGYLSELIKGTKKNPSRSKLTAIANFLKIPVSSFDQPPPSQKLLDQVADYDPEVVLRLSQHRKSKS